MPYSYTLSFLHQPLRPCSFPGSAILVEKKGADASSGCTRGEGPPEKDVCTSGEVCWRSHSCSVRAGAPFSPPPVSGQRLGWDLLSILKDAQGRKLSHPLPQSHLQMTSTLSFCLSLLLHSCGNISLVSLDLCSVPESSSPCSLARCPTWEMCASPKCVGRSSPGGRGSQRADPGPSLIRMGLESGFPILKSPEDSLSMLVNAAQSLWEDEKHNQEVNVPKAFQEWPREQMSWTSL